MYQLTISATPPMALSEPDITAIGAEHSAINGEVPNMTITINNARGQHTAAIVASNLLRLRATLERGSLTVFTGAVQAVTLGSDIVIELEA